jgi:hypothetical protein
MIGPILSGTPRAKFDAAHYAMTISGNSISDPGVSDLWTQVAALAPLGGQLTLHNCAHDGYSIQQLAGTRENYFHAPADVDAAYEDNKVNFLFFWELTNNIHNDGRRWCTSTAARTRSTAANSTT